MTPLTVMLIGTAVQSGLIVLLAADRWVHRITGTTPLEARVTAIERTMGKANDRWSTKMSELSIYLDDRRKDFERLAQDVASLEGEMRGRTDTPYNPDDRRERRKGSR